MLRDAGVLARRNDALVRLLNVVDPALPLAERREIETALEDRAESLGDVENEVVLVDSEDVVDSIVEATGRHDLTVMGATGRVSCSSSSSARCRRPWRRVRRARPSW